MQRMTNRNETPEQKNIRVGKMAINLLRQNHGWEPLPGTQHLYTVEEFKKFIEGDNWLANMMRPVTYIPENKS